MTISSEEKTAKKMPTVWLVGAGPGDPGLLTRRGAAKIEQAEVLVYDKLVHPGILSLAPAGCEKIYVGKEPGRHSLPQEEICQLLVRKAREGKRTVRLKGGDPLVYGRGAEEAKLLAGEGVPFGIVPGVTAAVAAAAYSGVPLTERNTSSSVVFLTGHEDPKKEEMVIDWEFWGSTAATLCIYMGMGHLAEICRRLMAGGRSPETPATVIQSATWSQQRSVRGSLQHLPDLVSAEKIGPPAMILIGETVRWAEEIDWFPHRPLAGARVAITRNREGQGRLKPLLEEQGAEVLELPLIKVSPLPNEKVWQEVVETFGTYDWLVFSSRVGAEIFFRRFLEQFSDLRALGAVRIAAVGEGTAEVIRGYHLTVDVIPPVFTGDAMVEAMMAENDLDSYGILVVTGTLGGKVIEERLREEGRAIVDRLELYETRPTDLSEIPDLQEYREGGADYMVFTSSSAVESFAQRAKDFLPGEGARTPQPVSFGPRTSETLEAKGLTAQIALANPSNEGLVEALVNHCQGKV
ncbi:MAG: uroporphyrinogen-III C-methyltransferase [Opitutales bacterium]|nr:uroporphyrinogen-III C-methyltransferase [Opitutales bacterium]MCH8541837.1 uroporphyrinogen-III C-methyltransferase [Opitutales bacterium]